MEGKELLTSLGNGLVVVAIMIGVAWAMDAMSAGLIVAAVAVGAVTTYADHRRRARKHAA